MECVGEEDSGPTLVIHTMSSMITLHLHMLIRILIRIHDPQQKNNEISLKQDGSSPITSKLRGWKIVWKGE